MSTHSDDIHVSDPLDDRATDALLAGRSVPGEESLSALVAEVLAMAEGPAPTPSAALAELLEHGLVPSTGLLPTLLAPARRRWLLPIPLTAGALAAAAGLFGAATANALPAPAQRIVSDTVGTLTPLHLPRPASKPTPAVSPAPAPSEDPTHATYQPTEAPGQAEPAERPRTPGADDQRDGHRDRGRDNGESRDTRPADDQDAHDDDGRSAGDEQHDRSGPTGNGPGGGESRDESQDESR